MRTFVIRARKGPTRWEKIRSNIGVNDHFEVVAHSVINAFFTSNGFRNDVEVYIILESTNDFPRTLRLMGSEGLSLSGFHEGAVIELVEHALQNSTGLKKDETKLVGVGVSISGFGFEKCIQPLLQTRPVYLLDPKGNNIQSITIDSDPIFILSDHLSMPKNNIKSMKRQGLQTISLGKKMLFASQCIVLINHHLDRD